jgi:hypothetical protein
VYSLFATGGKGELNGGKLRGCLEGALELDERARHRLGKAGTSVSFRIAGDEAVTLLLDRQPPELSSDNHAEIALDLDADQAERFGCGELVIANCLMLGTTAYDGPVRKYLAVDPILRGLLRRQAGKEL